MAEICKVKIKLVGHCCQNFPLIKISVNHTCIWNQEVLARQIIDYEFFPKHSNLLEIEHYNKNNDTQIDSNGNILKDRYCLIEQITIDELSFNLDWFSQHNVYFIDSNGDKIITNYLGKDGVLTFKFDWPLWKFWKNSQ